MSREEGLYKDKIEVSLDGRQIFYLFFGGAVIVGLVFVLGVMVGRRVEARGHVERAQTQAAVDPLAALDHLEGGLSFQGSLRAGAGANDGTDVEKQIGELAKQKAPVPAAAKKEPAPAPAPVAVVAPKVEPKKPEPKIDAAAMSPIVSPTPAPVKVEKKTDDKPKGKFTLQLSSFQDKAEAEAYLANVKANGFSATPYLTEADVDGKTYFRIRIGNYRTIEAANDAKGEIEKATKKTATVMAK